MDGGKAACEALAQAISSYVHILEVPVPLNGVPPVVRGVADIIRICGTKGVYSSLLSL